MIMFGKPRSLPAPDLSLVLANFVPSSAGQAQSRDKAAIVAAIRQLELFISAAYQGE